jgi:hypothetical protein
MSLRFIPTKIHGALDYIVAIALIFAPMIFGFQSVGGAAVIIPVVLGIGLFLYSLFTNYEWGLIKVLGMPYHLIVDVVASVVLALSPFIFGFVKETPNAWVPHIVVGLTVILVVICSKTQPGTATSRTV